MNNDYTSLFYFYDEKSEIKVYTENAINKTLLLIKNELSKNLNGLKEDKLLLEFMAQKLHYFVFEHSFYSKIQEREIVLFDIL